MEIMVRLVSIVLATYNRAHLLEQAIQSVLNQTYENYELIVIDDGSTDDSVDLISKFRDPRIKLITTAHIGRSAARNLGLSQCKGDYITFLDSDDLYLPNKLEIQVSFFESLKDVGMIYTSADCFNDDDSSNTVMTYRALESGNIYRFIATYIPTTICLPTVMVTRKTRENVGYFDVTLERFEDIDYWRRISKLNNIQNLDIVTCKIRTHSGNSIVNIDGKILTSEVRKYGQKVLREDFMLFGELVAILVMNFYRHYSKAIIEHAPNGKFGFTLLFDWVFIKLCVRIWKFLRPVLRFLKK